jgi:ferrous iron transport protein A
MEMGLTPGVECKVIGLAPLGDPLELELRGYRLSLRKSEAARIEIEPV